tara:strand:+ start:492 stop:1145 length:654 start_codon:yes stop_codon:yes gene_type:complete
MKGKIMCSRYELTSNFSELPYLLRKDVPQGLKEKYAKQELIKPTDPVIVLRNEGKTTTSIMLWGFISEWTKDPFDKARPRPFNARAETVAEKKLFRGSWKHKRCLIPATGFFEKGYRICRIDKQPFWLAGIWNRWMSPEGGEIESCCVLTTEPNELVKPLHNRMPVIIPYGLEEEWMASVKDGLELRDLKPMMGKWNPKGWETALINAPKNSQMSFF